MKAGRAMRFKSSRPPLQEQPIPKRAAVVGIPLERQIGTGFPTFAHCLRRDSRGREPLTCTDAWRVSPVPCRRREKRREECTKVRYPVPISPPRANLSAPAGGKYGVLRGRRGRRGRQAAGSGRRGCAGGRRRAAGGAGARAAGGGQRGGRADGGRIVTAA